MNRRSFLKWTGATLTTAIVGLPTATASKAPALPYIMILQPLSPHLAGVAGAKAGMLMNTETDEVFDSIEFVPCHTQHLYLEWRNRQGYVDSGFAASSKLVGTHTWDSDIVRAAKAASTQFYKYKTPDGNALIETYYLYGLQVKGDKVVTPCVISFSGAMIKPYKNFLAVAMRAIGRPPLLAFKLRISTVLEQNKSGRFYNYWIEPAKGHWTMVDDWSVDVSDSLLAPDHALLRNALEFRKQVMA